MGKEKPSLSKSNRGIETGKSPRDRESPELNIVGENVHVGERVRVFTFLGDNEIEGENAHFIEGIVRNIERGPSPDYDKYEIEIEREIIAGKEDSASKGDFRRPLAHGGHIEKI